GLHNTPDTHSLPVSRPLPDIPAHLYPVLFQAAFLDGRPLVLQDLVATWPFPELHYLQLVGDLELTHQSSLGSHLSLFPPTSNLQTPLESLELPFCSLIPDDLAFLSQSFHAPALKRLKLSSYDISQGLLEPLRLLLEKASASLLHLDLSYCYIADSHLAVLLPTLLRCSRLRFLGLNSNPLSRAAIKDLLQKTLELPNLHLVVYPYPLDCYTGDPSAFEWHLGEFVDAEILRRARGPMATGLRRGLVQQPRGGSWGGASLQKKSAPYSPVRLI
uniref:Leucine-rich repeat-containing protein 14 n=1 Tax=Catharus ustulatus TaxID=91951 RepID=A0A8C3U0Z2_CATUS